MNLKKNNFCFLMILAFFGLEVAYAESQPPKIQKQLKNKPVHSDRVIVRFNTNQQTASGLRRRTTLLSSLGLKKKNTIKFDPPASSSSTRIMNQELAFTVFSMDGSKALKTLLKKLNNDSSVLYAEPDYVVHLKNQPNDARYSELWALDNQGQGGGVIDADMGASEAWDTVTDSSNIVVGVIDSGVDYNHEDLAANMWVNPGETPNDGIDNDGNGYVDDIHGIDCANKDSDPMDEEGHGTHLAGTISAVGDNGIGVTGVNWNAKIMALKLDNSQDSEEIFVSATIECLAYVVNMKQNYGINIRITNNSYGNKNSQAQKDAIQASANADMLFVTASGNSGVDNDIELDFPGDYDIDNIISVTATNSSDQLADFSNFGATSVDIGAPGVDILSTVLDNKYETMDGTSMAAPYVAGAAALLWANDSSLTAVEIKNKLMSTGDPIDDLTDRTVSGRRLNVNTAINCTSGSPVLKILSPNDRFNLPVGVDVIINARITDCGQSITNTGVVALSENGDVSFALKDDGEGQDTRAEDGIYTGIGSFQQSLENMTLTVNADSLGLSESTTGKVVKNYTLDSAQPFNWIDPTSGTRLGISDADDETEIVPIGFDFEFYGISYTEINVDTNGVLTFGKNESSYVNTPIPQSSTPNGLIAPYWDDLFPENETSASIYTLLEGTAPNRRLTIAWLETPLHDEDASDRSVTFEATLYEGSNDIIFQYKDAYQADSASIGIEHQSGDYGLQYLNNGGNNGESVDIHEQQAIRFYLEEDSVPVTPVTPEKITVFSADDANNRVKLGSVLAVSKWEHAFFKFDVRAVSQKISKATFRVYYMAFRDRISLYVSGVNDDNWSKVKGAPAITFIHDSPGLQMAKVGETTITPGYVEFDVTDFVVNQLGRDGMVTLEVSSSHDNWDLFNSTEGEHPPELIIE